MRVHGILEYIAGVFSLIGAFVCLIVFFTTKIGYLWIGIACSLLAGIIIICIAQTFINDANRLDKVEGRVESLASSIENMHVNIGKDSSVSVSNSSKPTTNPAKQASNSIKPGSMECPNCHAILKVTDTECFNCGAKVEHVNQKPVYKQPSGKDSVLLSDEIRCKNCGTINKDFRTNCYACDAPLK